MQPSRLFLSYPDHRAPRTVLVISPANRIVSAGVRVRSPTVTMDIQKMPAVLSTERIERSILLIRGHRVMLDADLAELYGVETRALIQAVKRILSHFPADFMFQLTKEEFESLRSQIVISNSQ